MQKIPVKAYLWDTVYVHWIECEVVEVSIKKDNTRYQLRNKKESPFSESSFGWFQWSEFERKWVRQKTIGFRVHE